MLIEQLIDLKIMRTDNLKFRTDLPDLVMDGWSVTQKMNVYKEDCSKFEPSEVTFLRLMPRAVCFYLLRTVQALRRILVIILAPIEM